MTATEVLTARRETDCGLGQTRPERRGWGLSVGLVLLGGLLLFLHGCHGDDEDHELFYRSVSAWGSVDPPARSHHPNPTPSSTSTSSEDQQGRQVSCGSFRGVPAGSVSGNFNLSSLRSSSDPALSLAAVSRATSTGTPPVPRCRLRARQRQDRARRDDDVLRQNIFVQRSIWLERSSTDRPRCRGAFRLLAKLLAGHFPTISFSVPAWAARRGSTARRPVASAARR
jgi:hypothetical protein